MSDNEKKAQKLIVEEIRKANDHLINHFEKFCEDTKGTSIPLIYIKESYKIFINALEESLNKEDGK